jgi:bacillithiol biosynthesis deacetylase BshB1
MAMSKLDVLAVGAHPDDVELGCGGTLALLAGQGRRVGILHLTRGERGTRGTAAEREDEAQRAAAALGAVELAFLDCGDGALRTGEAEEDALIGALRAFRPDLVFGPTPHDRHPDHGRAHALVEAACFYAGLTNRAPSPPGGAPAFRPAAVFSYMQHDPFPPSFIVDVTAGWEAKMASLAAYRSQLHQPADKDKRTVDETPPVTKVSTPQFRLAVEGRARHFGEMINAEFGEPFWNRIPLAVRDPWALLPGGVR